MMEQLIIYAAAVLETPEQNQCGTYLWNHQNCSGSSALLWSGSDSIGLTGERGLPSLLLVTLLNQE